jgi:hypothetical protein
MTTTSEIDVVHHTTGGLLAMEDHRRTALAALREGRETLIHWHPSSLDTYRHTSCEFYVLDWHDEPEYAQLKQTIAIDVADGA